MLQTVTNPLPGIHEALIICGSDKRGTIFGVYELSRTIGVVYTAPSVKPSYLGPLESYYKI